MTARMGAVAILAVFAVGGLLQTATPRIEEDEAGWNCLTMGNRVCGPAFVPVSAEQADALAEGDDTDPEHADTRDWEACLVDPAAIVCPDGYTVTL